MRTDKELAIHLRKQGKSYKQINRQLGVPKSTLSAWFFGTDWSDKLKTDLERKARLLSEKRLKLYNQKRREAWEQWRMTARQEAERFYFFT